MSLHVMCTLLSEPFSLSFISQVPLIQIPCYAQSALGPPRSCLFPRPALKKAGTGSKNLSIREAGKADGAQHNSSQTPFTGGPIRAAICRVSTAGQSQAGMRKVVAKIHRK